MRPSDIANARADIILAKGILAMPLPTLSENPTLYNHAVYHSVQAMEKLLKGIVKGSSFSYDRTMLGKHNISDLFVTAALSRSEIVKEYEFLSQNVTVLNTANSLRYGKVAVSERDEKGICYLAEKMCDDMEKQYAKSVGKSVSAVRESALHYYDNLDPMEFVGKVPEPEDR